MPQYELVPGVPVGGHGALGPQLAEHMLPVVKFTQLGVSGAQSALVVHAP
ncbi:MAG: hypothetical protein IPN77_20155 [Sandaracinaceae bacterium]|nr:hypothetical protein [Sandaracinaceae bacterium]